MPRRTRIHLAGLLLPTVQRGHNRAACFFDDQDRRAYLDWQHKALPRERCRMHADVLIADHVHLLPTSEAAERVPRVPSSSSRRYLQSVNHTHGRTGIRPGGRYTSSPVRAETCLLRCQRYVEVELNPGRAGMVPDPGQSRWSSYPANALGAPDALLTPHRRCLGLGADEEPRRAAYRGRLRIALDDQPLGDLRLAIRQDRPIGNDRFYRGD